MKFHHYVLNHMTYECNRSTISKVYALIEHLDHMPRVRMRSEAYSSVCVCHAVSVDCYSCSIMTEVQARVYIGFYSHVFLNFNSWICKIMLHFQVIARFA